MRYLVGLLVLPLFPFLVQLPNAGAALDPSLQRETDAAIRRAVKWLISRQSPAGYWSNPDYPALTALPLWAIIRSGLPAERTVAAAVDYIRSCARPDGGIYRKPRQKRRGGGLKNYNTALCMIALFESGQKDVLPLVLKARRFLSRSQHLDDDIYYGGMGYDARTDRAYADLSNSYIAYEAMRLTESAEDMRRGGPRATLNWEAARRFLARVQNLPEFNDLPWAGGSHEELGGFVYRPDKSQAGVYADTNGVIRFRTYGSMTYAGLLSLIYAEVDRNDPRVRSAFDWARRHWTLDENPGMGADGLFYFYNVLAKCLAVLGRSSIPLQDGTSIDWRTELARRLVSLQKIEADGGLGYWVNEKSGRWWESDPVLVTAYSLLALEMASGTPAR
ncbi:MAG TPA: cycloartenol synthase [Kiritimatiellae bacterium]|nr:cycloartenol synthase [Kiritimatiellia bacterium]